MMDRAHVAFLGVPSGRLGDAKMTGFLGADADRAPPRNNRPVFSSHTHGDRMGDGVGFSTAGRKYAGFHGGPVLKN